MCYFRNGCEDLGIQEARGSQTLFHIGVSPWDPYSEVPITYSLHIPFIDTATEVLRPLTPYSSPGNPCSSSYGETDKD